MLNFRSLAFLGFAYAAASAQASLTYFDAVWQGSYYGNAASATGVIGIDLSLLVKDSFDFQNISPAAAIQSIDMTVAGSTTAAFNGHFVTADFDAYVTQFTLPIDTSVQWIGQDQGSGTTYGDDSGTSDFNLFVNATSNAPSGVNFFDLETGGVDGQNQGTGEQMRLVSFAPQAVPEPASMAALGFGALALIKRRKKA
ncbi:PEP-CTERM sorting domain-containing protein [bacterium]|nr:MAG: PEP-CTERM sorting domain-containing protein [bacterium]